MKNSTFTVEQSRADEYRQRLSREQWTRYLRELIHPWHQAAEETPFARAMIDGTMSRESYIKNLQNLRTIHLFVETEIDRSPVFKQVFRESMRRVRHIERDLEALGAEPCSLHTEAQEFIAQCQELVDNTPLSVFGLLYVLEGSRMGSMFLMPCIMNALNLELREGVGLDYHYIGASHTPARFRQFKDDLNDAIASLSDRVAIAQAACVMMSGLSRMYRHMGQPSSQDTELRLSA